MIAIVGGGWFGCHIASCLKARSIDFELFEERPRLFDGASGHNQNRLHLGFHYPRSAITRRQSFEFAQTFMREYPSLSEPVEDNIYAVCSKESLIDWETYRTIMGNGPYWEQRNPADYGLKNVDGCLACDERVILTDKAREQFARRLDGHLRLGERFEGQENYDRIINCSYQTWRPAWRDLIYEACLTLIYRSSLRRAITLMDGPFYSIYPFNGDTVTLYSVEHSRQRWSAAFQAQDVLRLRTDDEVNRVRGWMERGVSKWLPSFCADYEFAGHHSAIRAIANDASDARVCRVIEEGNTIHVLSGKIDSIFYAEQEVMRCLKCY